MARHICWNALIHHYHFNPGPEDDFWCNKARALIKIAAEIKDEVTFVKLFTFLEHSNENIYSSYIGAKRNITNASCDLLLEDFAQKNRTYKYKQTGTEDLFGEYWKLFKYLGIDTNIITTALKTEDLYQFFPSRFEEYWVKEKCVPLEMTFRHKQPGRPDRLLRKNLFYIAAADLITNYEEYLKVFMSYFDLQKQGIHSSAEKRALEEWSDANSKSTKTEKQKVFFASWRIFSTMTDFFCPTEPDPLILLEYGRQIPGEIDLFLIFDQIYEKIGKEKEIEEIYQKIFMPKNLPLPPFQKKTHTNVEEEEMQQQ